MKPVTTLPSNSYQRREFSKASELKHKGSRTPDKEVAKLLKGGASRMSRSDVALEDTERGRCVSGSVNANLQLCPPFLHLYPTDSTTLPPRIWPYHPRAVWVQVQWITNSSSGIQPSYRLWSVDFRRVENLSVLFQACDGLCRCREELNDPGTTWEAPVHSGSERTQSGNKRLRHGDSGEGGGVCGGAGNGRGSEHGHSGEGDARGSGTSHHVGGGQNRGGDGVASGSDVGGGRDDSGKGDAGRCNVSVAVGTAEEVTAVTVAVQVARTVVLLAAMAVTEVVVARRGAVASAAGDVAAGVAARGMSGRCEAVLMLVPSVVELERGALRMREGDGRGGGAPFGTSEAGGGGVVGNRGTTVVGRVDDGGGDDE
ncbi:Protein of unknown function [Gryllus bimaculatus]|nr:Protein of unknown function [Gryllus bimaculatus]